MLKDPSPWCRGEYANSMFPLLRCQDIPILIMTQKYKYLIRLQNILLIRHFFVLKQLINQPAIKLMTL